MVVFAAIILVLAMCSAPGCKSDRPSTKPTTSLYNAVYGGSVEEVEAHVRSGNIDLEYRHESGGSLLHIAGRGCRRWENHYNPPCRSHQAIVKLLLDNGASVDVRDKSGRTLLHYLANERFAKMEDFFCLLISRGADASAVDNEGWTPLHKAVSAGNLVNVKSLVANGADINAAPSHLVLPSGRHDINTDRSTPLDIAVKKDNVEIIRYLHGKGAKTTRTYSAKIEAAGSPLINGKSWRNAANLAHEPAEGPEGNLYKQGRAIEDIVLSKMSELQDCISEAYSKFPRNMRGKLSVRFTIESGGSVREAYGYSHWTYRELEWCIAKKIRGMKFPGFPGRGIVMVEYPFKIMSLGAEKQADKPKKDAECTPGEEKCKDLSTALVCSEAGKWKVKQECRKGTACSIDSWGDGTKYAGCFETVDLKDVLPDGNSEEDKEALQRVLNRRRTTEKAYVEKVLDGDTIKVRLLPSGTKVTVRLLGIDCPESHKNAKCQRDGDPEQNSDKDKKHQESVIRGHDCRWQIPLGLKASKRAAKLLKHKTVLLECPGKCKKGAYGRALSYVRIPDPKYKEQYDHEKIRMTGQDFGKLMISEGYCEDFGWKYPHPRSDGYKQIQTEVRLAGEGIWKGEELPPLFIGKGLAEGLRVKKGDVVWIVSPPVGPSDNPNRVWFRVEGIFETGNLVLDEKRVCATPEGLGPLRRERKLGIIEGIVSSQHNIMGVDVYELKEEEATADGCKKALVVP